MITYNEAKWKDNKLYVRGKDTGIMVGPDQVHPNMFRIGWDTGEISADFYNLTHARDNAMKYYQRKENGIAEEVVPEGL